ncbi:MAG: glycosyltransferase [Deltaproteobacteria bacterium]|nr:glycosyltransferase [Deltaproteobacteria bacterium]
MARILYLHRDPSFAQFIRDDLEILSRSHDVTDVRAEGTFKASAKLARAAARADLIYVWWGDLVGVGGLTLALLRSKPSVLVTGGYDIADVPEIRYGLKYHRVRKHLPPLALRLATRVLANSDSARSEVVRNYGIDASRIDVVPHGFDIDRYVASAKKERRVLTVGLISRPYIPYKGLRTFVEAARLLPDVPFVHAGPSAGDGALEELKTMAPKNVSFLGFLPTEELLRQLRISLVYAQLSAHEGFGMALAEAMLSGATPVATDRGAIPEVAGDVCRYVPYGDAAGTANGISAALEEPRGAAARARIAELFPMSRRREGVLRLVDEALQTLRQR